jgi:hypothetical protein
MVLKEQEDNGTKIKRNCPYESSLPVPEHQKNQVRHKCQSTRHIINNVARNNSCIKGALLVRCIHVGMVLKEQEDSGIMPILCCQCERSFSVPAQNVIGER